MFLYIDILRWVGRTKVIFLWFLTGMGYYKIQVLVQILTILLNHGLNKWAFNLGY